MQEVIKQTKKRLKLYEWLRDTGVDIALIQETHYVEKIH